MSTRRTRRVRTIPSRHKKPNSKLAKHTGTLWPRNTNSTHGAPLPCATVSWHAVVPCGLVWGNTGESLATVPTVSLVRPLIRASVEGDDSPPHLSTNAIPTAYVYDNLNLSLDPPQNASRIAASHKDARKRVLAMPQTGT